MAHFRANFLRASFLEYVLHVKASQERDAVTIFGRHLAFVHRVLLARFYLFELISFLSPQSYYKKLCSALPGNWISQTLGKQLLRSGTFVGANYRAVCRAKSNSDFINKLRIVEEECDESLFWMELLADNNLVKPSRLVTLMKEADEILAIVVSSAKTARSSGRA